ncbi:MAG: D-alanine--D-alanine ligase [Elusimicrobiota bacterium]|jgi:D-alanine-D-alanine ligase|nr:D-alanine--D-alanine ligase [Elusimicrobiota bacterium]
MKKLKIALLYGGKSSEHDVSIHSAFDVGEILQKKYEVYKIFISKEGRWFLQENIGPAATSDREISPVISPDTNLYTKDGKSFKVDVFFPVLHGAMGEDGTMQGLFEILNTPYVGSSVLTSAIGMDKELCKLLASFYGVPIVPYIKLEKGANYILEDLKKAVLALGYPLFVKPMSLGSSIGVTRVENEAELEPAIKKAFEYEGNILVEKGIDEAREFFCAVVGSGAKAHTSLCGELATVNSKFFDYKAKYEDPHGCDMKIPAQIPSQAQDKMRQYSLDIFKVLRGEGMARVDFLYGKDGKFYFSEINTIPGLSASSLFPQLWQASGKEYPQVLDLLIDMAIKRHSERKAYSLER